MKKLATTIAILTTVALFGGQKWYLEPEQIVLSEQTIFVQVENEMIEIDHLRVDQGGVYFEDENARCTNCRQPLHPDTNCYKRLNPKNTCHRRLNPKNTCHITSTLATLDR